MDFCPPHLHLTPPLGGGWFPSEYCHAVWYGKIRMAWLPDGEKISKICLFVSTKCTNVTDTHRQTDTACWHIGRACMASRGKNCQRQLRRGPAPTPVQKFITIRRAWGSVSTYARLCAPKVFTRPVFHFPVFEFLQLATAKDPGRILTQNTPKHEYGTRFRARMFLFGVSNTKCNI